MPLFGFLTGGGEERFHFFFQQGGHSMFCQVDLGQVDAEVALDALGGPLFHHVAIEYLILPRRDLCLYALEGGLEEIRMPFGIPDRFEFRTGGVDGPRNGRGSRRIGVQVRLRGQALAELIGDPPPGDLEEPPLEGAARRIVPEAIRPARHCEERLLHGIVRLGVSQAGPAGKGVDHL